jgi:hypothetical protein
MPTHDRGKRWIFRQKATEIVAATPLFTTRGRSADSAEKWGEKSGDFYTPSPLKNYAESTY